MDAHRRSATRRANQLIVTTNATLQDLEELESSVHLEANRAEHRISQSIEESCFLLQSRSKELLAQLSHQKRTRLAAVNQGLVSCQQRLAILESLFPSKPTLTISQPDLQSLRILENEDLPLICHEVLNLQSSFELQMDESGLNKIVNKFGYLSENALWQVVCTYHRGLQTESADGRRSNVNDGESLGSVETSSTVPKAHLFPRYRTKSPSVDPTPLICCPAGAENTCFRLNRPIRRPRRFHDVSRQQRRSQDEKTFATQSNYYDVPEPGIVRQTDATTSHSLGFAQKAFQGKPSATTFPFFDFREPVILEQASSTTSPSSKVPEPVIVKRASSITSHSSKVPEPVIVKRASSTTSPSSKVPEPVIVKRASSTTSSSSKMPEPVIVERASSTTSSSSKVPEPVIVEQASSTTSPSSKVPEQVIVKRASSTTSPSSKVPEPVILEQASSTTSPSSKVPEQVIVKRASSTTSPSSKVPEQVILEQASPTTSPSSKVPEQVIVKQASSTTSPSSKVPEPVILEQASSTTSPSSQVPEPVIVERAFSTTSPSFHLPEPVVVEQASATTSPSSEAPELVILEEDFATTSFPCPGVADLVIVSHFESPGYFFVRHCADSHLYVKLNEALQSTRGRDIRVPDSIAVGQVLCVRSVVDGCWHRARVSALTKVEIASEAEGGTVLEGAAHSSCPAISAGEMDTSMDGGTCDDSGAITRPAGTTGRTSSDTVKATGAVRTEDADECARPLEHPTNLQAEDDTAVGEMSVKVVNDDTSTRRITSLLKSLIDKSNEEEMKFQRRVKQVKTQQKTIADIVSELSVLLGLGSDPKDEQAECTLDGQRGGLVSRRASRRRSEHQEVSPLDLVLKLECFLIDHGRKELVRLRESPEHAATAHPEDRICGIAEHLASRFHRLPPAAFRCALKDVAPAHQWSGWSEKRQSLFKGKVVGSVVQMVTVGNGDDGELLVNIKRPPFYNDEILPVSLKHTLPFLDPCRLKTSPSVPRQTVFRRGQWIPPPAQLDMLSRSKVTICHVHLLSSFFIQKVKGKVNVAFNDMMLKLQEIGDKQPTLRGWMIRYCVARFIADNAWYRADIIGVLLKQKAKVRFIDYGNVDVVRTSELRELPNEFCELPEQAVCCCLHGVDGGGEEEAQKFMMYVGDELTCYVKGVRGDGVWEVELFHHRPDGKTVCLNSIFGAKDQDGKSRPAKSQVILDAVKKDGPSEEKISILQGDPSHPTDSADDVEDVKRPRCSTPPVDRVTCLSGVDEGNENGDPCGPRRARSDERPLRIKMGTHGLCKKTPSDVPEDTIPPPSLEKQTSETVGEEEPTMAVHRQGPQSQSVEPRMKSLTSLSGSDDRSSSDDARGPMDPGSHHRVRVSHVESPNYFCVQTASWCDGPLDRMQKDLWRSAWNQPIGDDNPGTPVGPLTLTEGLRCSAVSFRHNAWVRVQVDRVNDDGKVQVFLLDWGGTEKMNRSQLRSLPEHCQKIPPIALRCFLPDLRPTGDDSRWSSSTCEFMADYLVGKFCFITQSKDSGRESQDSGVIPVEVSVGCSARHLSNFRDVLIKQGLALPRRKIEGNLELVRVRKQCEQAPDESLMSGGGADVPGDNSEPRVLGPSDCSNSECPTFQPSRTGRESQEKEN